MTKYEGTPATWAETFKMMLELGTSMEDLSRANHLGLETGAISLEHFQAAARVLAKEILKR